MTLTQQTSLLESIRLLKPYLQHTHIKEKHQVLGCQTQLQLMLMGSLVSCLSALSSCAYMFLSTSSMIACQ